MPEICAAGSCEFCGREFRKPSEVMSHRCAAMREAKVRGHYGLSADDILEREAGGVEHRARVLVELASAVYVAQEAFSYDTDGDEAEEHESTRLVQLLDQLQEQLGRISLLPDGELTAWRECRRCSGAGRTSGEDPCIECGGAGAVHAEEADG